MVASTAMTNVPSVIGRFELSFTPDINVVSLVRAFVTSFYSRVLGEEVTGRIALVAHELLENAVKYSAGGEAAIRIDIEDAVDRRVCIRTWNNADPAAREAVATVFRETAEASDPLAFYIEQMHRSVARGTGSGLGLARIRAEAEMDLEYDYADGKVCVIARAPANRGDR